MTTLKKPFYFCTECKKIVKTLDDLLFIDEFSLRGFCSKDCIEDFHFPLIKYYEAMEHSLRKKYHAENEEVALEVDNEILEVVLTSPDEIFRLGNELQENFYYYIKHFGESAVIVVASVYRKEASFIYLITATKSKALLNEFRAGEDVREWLQRPDEIVEDEKGHEYQEAEEASEEGEEDMLFIQLLESKKSQLLADILVKRKDSDIPFEDYSGYESCFEETLEVPDEVFERRDNEGDKLFSYIKTFTRGPRPSDSFYYIVVCLKRNEGVEVTNVYPVLGLPTTDMEMCQEFRIGTRLTGPLQN